MKSALVIGYGSIGKRHTRLLQELGRRVAVVSRRAKPGHSPSYGSISAALKKERPDYTVIANETSEHARTLRALQKSRFIGTTLVEKPIFDSPQPLAVSPKTFVAYNLRFHPGVLRLRRLLAGEKILSVQMYAGGYLPEWRQGRDYRRGYSADRKRGGGALRDLSHELDLALWLFGSWRRVAAIGGHFSRLKITSDDAFGLLVATRRCPLLTLQVNYFDRTTHREILVNTERHTHKLDLAAGKLWTDGRAQGMAVDRDVTYRAQHEAAFKNDRRVLCAAAQGLEVAALIRAAEKAAKEKRWVNR